MRRIIRLTESDLTRIVRRVISESEDPENAIETCDEDDDDAMEECVDNLFAGMSEEEAEDYLNELITRKPKWLRKLARWMTAKGRKIKRMVKHDIKTTARDIKHSKPEEKAMLVTGLVGFPFLANWFFENIQKILNRSEDRE